MDRESLLTRDDIEKLESWSDGYFYKIFYYLEDFIAKGVENNSFTLSEAKADLEIALWYAYAGNNIDVYEYYYKVINWMPFSEDNAKGCGAWFYRYSVALLYCSKIEESYKYAQKGVKEEPNYPWGWLNLAKLHYYFGRKEEALSAIEHGSKLVEDKHEFTILRKEIDEGCSLEQLLCHYIKEDDDKTLQSEENAAELVEKLQAINGVVCDQDNLNAIKNILKVKSWQENIPYCNFESSFKDDQIIRFVFTMNSASLSKIKKRWIEDLVIAINSDRLSIQRYGNDYKLIQVEITRALEVKFTYYDKKNGRVLLDYQVEQNVISASTNGQMGNIALTLLRQRDTIEYIECWLEDDKIVKHFGHVGDKGQLKVYENCSAEDYKMYLDIFIGRYEKLGYVSWKDFPKKSVVLSLKIVCGDNFIQEDKSSPVYFVYEMMQKLLEINVVGFFNDWGFKFNESANCYDVDFYFDTVDEDLLMRLLKASLNIFDTKSMITVKSLESIKD